jgi:hypothetical protein
MPGKHGCTGTTRRGTPCNAHPLKGSDPKVCISHASREVQESVGFGGSQPNAGRPRLPGVLEVARQLVEENAAVLVAPHFRTLGYDVVVVNGRAQLERIEGGGAKVHATFEGEVLVSEHDDLGAQIAASEKLVDRVVGKPKQAIEASGPGGTPLGPMFVTDPDLAEDARALLRRAANAGSDEPRGPSDSY